MDFGVEAVRSGGHGVLTVWGELDAYTAPRLRERIIGVVGDGVDRLVVDLTRVTFMDSSGLGTLVAAKKRLHVSDKSLCLVLDPEQRSLRRLFEITSLDRVLPIHDSVDAAVDDCLNDPAA
jgi:anti-sigma B factor antagonist